MIAPMPTHMAMNGRIKTVQTLGYFSKRTAEGEDASYTRAKLKVRGNSLAGDLEDHLQETPIVQNVHISQ